MKEYISDWFHLYLFPHEKSLFFTNSFHSNPIPFSSLLYVLRKHMIFFLQLRVLIIFLSLTLTPGLIVMEMLEKILIPFFFKSKILLSLAISFDRFRYNREIFLSLGSVIHPYLSTFGVISLDFELNYTPPHAKYNR